MSKEKIPKLNIDQAGKVLANVFEKCDVAENTIPVDELKSYSNYRKQRYLIQQVLLVVFVLLVFISPMLFIMPRVSYSIDENGDRGFPVYTVDVLTMLPVKSVVAKAGDYSIPVYASDSHLFTVEPIKDGEITISVTLFNGQTKTDKFEVTGTDKTAPDYLGMKEDNGMVYLYFSDSGSGFCCRKSYMVIDGTDEYIAPAFMDEENGCIGFEINGNKAEIVASDIVGNTRTITITR